MPEHLEDIAVEYGTRWRFIQVKSRNPELGLWKLSDIAAEGGAVRSLFRTYQQIADVDATLELILEGAINPRDPISRLRLGQDHTDNQLVQAVSKALSLTDDKARDFLARVVLASQPAARPDIRARNILLIQEQNRAISLPTAEQIHERLIGVIERVMRADPAGTDWPRYVTHPDERPSDLEEKIAAKRLTREQLRAQVAPLTNPPRPLLRRITEPGGRTVSILEQKLSLGGASLAIVERARELRANAQLRKLDLANSDLFFREEVLEDLHQRLQTHVAANQALHASSTAPANEMFAGLLAQFTASPNVIDPNNVMRADPMLLLGEVCELAELCRVDWGMTNAQ